MLLPSRFRCLTAHRRHLLVLRLAFDLLAELSCFAGLRLLLRFGRLRLLAMLLKIVVGLGVDQLRIGGCLREQVARGPALPRRQLDLLELRAVYLVFLADALLDLTHLRPIDHLVQGLHQFPFVARPTGPWLVLVFARMAVLLVLLPAIHLAKILIIVSLVPFVPFFGSTVLLLTGSFRTR